MAAVGSTTEMSSITRKIADRLWRSSPEIGAARMIFDGRPVSPAGAAFAGAFTIDSIDGHDTTSPCAGHVSRTPRHRRLAAGLGTLLSGKEFMVALTVTYEISYRAGLDPAWHRARTITPPAPGPRSVSPPAFPCCCGLARSRRACDADLLGG
ncbi:MAG: hypothetical protein EOR68_33235 [Mesorhizobium sp.]|nr:MAG: hypothetical protein EOR68_33235 [Mesorhizobium sp.]